MKTAARYIALYLAMVAVMTALPVALFALLPHSAVEPSVERSRQWLGSYVPESPYAVLQADVPTDRRMLSIADEVEPEAPLQSFMASRYTVDPTISGDGELIVTAADGSRLLYYSRYWHGYMVYLYPLLAMADYPSIRIVMAVVAALLLLEAAMVVWRRWGRRVAIAYAAGLMVVGYPVACMSLQYCSVFIAVMLTTFAIAAWGSNFRAVALIAFAGGAVTVYLDFLTTPMLALGYTLLLGWAAEESFGSRPAARNLHLLLYALSWAGGYVALWATRWWLAEMITGMPVVDNALDAIAYRSAAPFNATHLLHYLDKALVAIVIVAVVAVALLIWQRRRAMSALRSRWPLAVIALLPVAWWLVVRNHSVEFFWFTWRAVGTTVAATILLLWGSGRAGARAPQSRAQRRH